MSIFCRFPVDQACFRMNSTVIQRRLLDSGYEKMGCGKSHNLAVDMDRSQRRGYNFGFRRIVKTA